MIAVSNVCCRNLAGLGLQLTLVMPSTGIATGFAALLALRIAQPIRLGIQQMVRRRPMVQVKACNYK
jgi:hypothetical protein